MTQQAQHCKFMELFDVSVSGSSTAQNRVNSHSVLYSLEKNIVVFLLFFTFLLTQQSSIAAPCPNESGVVGGSVFADYNMNGLDDQVSIGIAGISVYLYGDDSTLIDTKITDDEGNYFFDNLSDGTTYRIEFTIPISDNIYGGFSSAESPTNIQFATAPTCDVKLGVSNPEDYCRALPTVMTPCFSNGDPLAINSTSADDAAIVAFSYSATGNDPKFIIATAGEVGSTSGIAIDQAAGTVYASAFLKRHVGLGPLGLGGIYAILDAESANPTTTQFIDVTTLGIDVGNIPSNVDRGLPANSTLPSTDAEAYGKIGKAGIGGLDISSDNSTLWFVNLFDKNIYSIPSNNPTAASVQSFSLPNAGCNNGELRPFAIQYYRGNAYVGAVCDASLGTSDDLEAIVYKLEGTTFSEILRYDLNYEKGRALRSCVDETGWFPWSDTFPEDCTGNGDYVYPSPVFSSMAFDIDGSLTMGFMDRTGNQLGFQNFDPTGTITNVKTTSGGDLLRAFNDNGTLILESNGTAGNITTAGADNGEGPGGGEFYFQDVFTNNLPPALYPHSETSQGAITIVPGTGSVLTTALDPLGTTVNAGGVNFYNNTTGIGRDPGFLLFSSGSGGAASFGKANGLGAITVSCGIAPLEIGNYVWIDTNENGVQDPSEMPLEGINVSLVDVAGNILATVQTDENGQYLFNNTTIGQNTVSENTNYTIVLGTNGQFDTATGILNDSLALTIANTGVGVNSDENDSDGVIATQGAFEGLPIIEVQTGTAGQNNHSYDFGFIVEEPIAAEPGTIEGHVFKDCENDGIRDGDPFLEGVTVQLMGTDIFGNTVDTATISASNNHYAFTNINPGTYIVKFSTPAGFVFSPKDQGNDDTVDSDADPITGETDAFMLASGQFLDFIDAGFFDNEAPVLSDYPVDMTINCSDLFNEPSVLTATDNCPDGATVSLEEIITNDECKSTIIRTWTATDACGNSTVHTQSIEAVDDSAPVITFTNPLLVGLEDGGFLEVECNGAPTFGPEDVSVMDDCDDKPSVVFQDFQIQQGDCDIDGFLYILTCGWIATDACGNSSTLTIDVHIVDTTDPVFTSVPNDITIECIDDIPNVETPTVEDNCTNNTQIIFNENQEGEGCELMIYRTWTAFDDCGNKAVALQRISVLDNEAPVFVSTPADVTISCEDDIPFFIPGTSDNCGSVDVRFDDVIKDGTQICTNTFEIDRIWVATDECGNVATHIQSIQVVDNTAPTISFIDPDWIDGYVIEATCQNIPVLMPQDAVATDNCDDNIIIELSNESESGTCLENGFLKKYTYTWTATDDCGNASTLTVVLLVTDNEPPVFDNAPVDITVTCGDLPEPDGISATDNCSLDVEVAFVETMGTSGCAGTGVIRTWIATDQCGNTAQVVQHITVEDNEPPVFVHIPPDQTLECDKTPADAYPNVTDNCSDAIQISLQTETIEGTCANESQMIRTWTATDVCGNTAVGTQIITIVDTTPPTFDTTALPDLTVSCDEIPDLDAMMATDACSGQILANPVVMSMQNGACDGASPLVITWTATDDCGNATTLTQNIFIIDTTPPVFDQTPDNITVECSAIPTPPTLTATDNCSNDVNVELSESQVDGDCENEFVIIRLWEATDVCGNQSSYIQQVHVKDNTAPVLSNIPSDMTVECDAIPALAMVTATDNCGNNTNVNIEMTEESIKGDCEQERTITRTWTATDACGNVTTGTQVITVIDTTAPVFTNVPEALIILSDGDPIPVIYEPLAIDNCDDNVTITFEETTEGNGCAQMIIRTWTATDNCGNATTFVQTISNNDMINIVASVTDDTCEGGEGSITIQIIGGVAPYTFSWSNGQANQNIDNLVSGSYTVTVTDSNGCSNQKTLLVDEPDDCDECDINIGDFVWYDYDQDGIQDINEPGVLGVTVNLISAGSDGVFNTADDMIVATDVTDNLGQYLFECVEPGDYIIEFLPITLPDNTTFTNQDAGDNDALDSDANPSTGQTDVFTVTEGQGDDLSFDAGIIPSDCINVDDGGEICCDQVLCGAGSIADPLTSTTPASGGFGTVEYLWMMSNTTPVFDATTWTIIPDATEADYAPGAVYQTTFYIRCARSQGCENYVAESNVIVIEIVTAPNGTINAPSSTCIDEGVTFEGESSAGLVSYEWIFEGATPATATTRKVEHVTWDVAGVYNITLITTTADCMSETTSTIVVNDCLNNFQFASVQAVEMDETTVALNWKVEHEHSNAVYVVEYSDGQSDFELIEVINVVTNNDEYEFIHKKARIGYNEYRIKYVHSQNNLIVFSPEKEVLINPRQAEVRFFPNPFAQEFQMEILNAREDVGQVEIVDAYGKILQHFEVSKDVKRQEIDLSGYPQGVYFVKLKFGWYPPTTYKMLKTFE